MSEMSDIMRSKNYIHIYTSMESCGSQKGIIYVEDVSDRLFWKLVIDTICPERYDIKVFSQQGSCGKRRLEQEYNHLHKDFLVAVDADYDYICPNRNEYSAILNSNPFVLHTFCYSRESYLHTEDAIIYFINSIHLNVNTENCIIQALSIYSEIIFDALCVFTFLHDRDSQEHKENIFNNSIRLQGNKRLLNDDLSINEEAINELRNSVSNYINHCEQFIHSSDDIIRHRDMLSDCGITKNNALLFINGHNLFDGIFSPIYDMYIKLSRKNEMAWVSDNFSEQVARDRKRQVDNHYKDNCKPSTLMYHCREYRNSPFWSKITDKLNDLIIM